MVAGLCDTAALHCVLWKKNDENITGVDLPRTEVDSGRVYVADLVAHLAQTYDERAAFLASIL